LYENAEELELQPSYKILVRHFGGLVGGNKHNNNYATCVMQMKVMTRQTLDFIRAIYKVPNRLNYSIPIERHSIPYLMTLLLNISI
jgi:hypothetical protein